MKLPSNGPKHPDPDPNAARHPRRPQNAVQDPMGYVSRPWSAVGVLPVHDHSETYITAAQLDHLDRVLADVPYLMADLEIAATRQDRFPNRPMPETNGSESPLPYRIGATETAQRLATAILGVAGIIWHRSTQGQPNPFRSSKDACQWLRSSLRILAQDKAAEEYARRISDLHAEALNGPIERPPSWHYLGVCPNCGDDLTAEYGAADIRCGCGWTRTVQAVVDDVLAATEDMLFTDTQLVGALELDGKIVTRERIKNWFYRGYLTGHDHQRWAPYAHKIVTVRAYRLGDVRQVIANMEAKANRS